MCCLHQINRKYICSAHHLYMNAENTTIMFITSGYEDSVFAIVDKGIQATLTQAIRQTILDSIKNTTSFFRNYTQGSSESSFRK